MNHILVKISFLLVVVVVTGCVPHFQKPVIDDHTQLALQETSEKGSPVMTYRNGVLEDFSYKNSRWSTWSEKLILNQEKGTIKVEAKQAGPDYANLSFKFPTSDFSKAPVIKITAKAEGNVNPVIKVVLKDINGNESNESPKSDSLKGPNFKDYYFNFKQKWRQNWPIPAKVDSTAIVEMLIYINSGGPEFTGNLYIDEVSAIEEKDAPKEPVLLPKLKKEEKEEKDSLNEITPPNILYSHKQKVDSWWSDKKMTLTKKDSALLVTAYEVGPKYEVLGKSFKSLNFKNTGVIRIMARAESGTKPHLKVSITDKKGHGANYEADTALISTEGGYKNYYFNFNKKYNQVWPDTVSVDPTQIVSMILFINGGKNPYTGKIYIREVEVIEEADIPDEEIERLEKLKKAKAAAPIPKVEKPLESGILYNPKDSIQSWWSDKKIIMIKQNDDLVLMGYGVGPKYEGFGKSFKPMNFTKSGVIRIRARAESKVMPILSISLSDKSGNGANYKPQLEKITTGKKYKDYYFNFNGKYKQVWPKNAKVNSDEIVSLILFINAGKTPFTGKLLINEVEVMTEAEAKKRREQLKE
jgi:hypothetical protein